MSTSDENRAFQHHVAMTDRQGRRSARALLRELELEGIVQFDERKNRYAFTKRKIDADDVNEMLNRAARA